MLRDSLCDLCGADSLDQIYQPERSGRGLKIYLCRHCGLVQSLPRIDRTLLIEPHSRTVYRRVPG